MGCQFSEGFEAQFSLMMDLNKEEAEKKNMIRNQENLSLREFKRDAFKMLRNFFFIGAYLLYNVVLHLLYNEVYQRYVYILMGLL